MNLDSIIINKYDFRLIIQSNIKNMFIFKEELYTTKVSTVYVDMNSVMSILFRYDKINDKELMDNITAIFEEFIDHAIRSSTRVKFLYSGKPSKVHINIYPDWCKKRYERVALRNSDFIMNFLTSMKIFGEKNKLIEIVNVEDKHVAMYIKEDSIYTPGISYIISKDFVCQCLIRHLNVIIFTGVNYIDFRDSYPSLFNGVELYKYLSEGSEWIYPVIAGDSRNEFSGARGYSIKNTLKYISEYKLKIVVGGEHPLREHIEKYRPLYDIDYMIEYYKNI